MPTHLFQRITVALSDTAEDEAVLRYSRLLHDLAGGVARFRFVHVLPEEYDADRRPPSHREAASSVARSIYRHFEVDDRATVHVLSGPRVDRLLEFTAESRSDLILVGHRQAGQPPTNPGRRSLGRRLAMKAPCSVWMVPEGAIPAVGRILAAVDFSASSAEALRFAAVLAKAAGMDCCLALHVVAPGNPASGLEATRASPQRDVALFQRFIAPLDLHGIDVRLKIEESGSVSRAIEEVAARNQIDLVVMGTRGRSASSAVLLGSESEQMLSETMRPLLVTKQHGQRLGVLEALLDRDFRQPCDPQFS